MTPIIIGAGRGRRLGALTAEVPKTMVPIVGKPMLEHLLDALAAGGFGPEQVVFICGYLAEVVQAAYPRLRYVPNRDWQHNNILLSLMCARGHLAGGFLSTYADIVYRPEAITRLLASPHDITLVCDTDWRRRYRDRNHHPESDAEKLRLDAERVVELSRHIASAEADGEFIGVMRLTAAGAARFIAAFDEVAARLGEEAEFREGRSLRKAYLIDLLAHMIDAGEPVHCLGMHGGYLEIDTTEDAAAADRWWAASSAG